MSDKVSCSNYPGQARVANLVDIALQTLQFASFPQVVTIRCTILQVELRVEERKQIAYYSSSQFACLFFLQGFYVFSNGSIDIFRLCCGMQNRNHETWKFISRGLLLT